MKNGETEDQAMENYGNCPVFLMSKNGAEKSSGNCNKSTTGGFKIIQKFIDKTNKS